MKKRSKPPPKDWLDEPEPHLDDDDDWVEFGGELMLVAGWTSGGAPYGTSVEVWNNMNERASPTAGRARVKAAMRRLLLERGVKDPDDRIGRVRYLGEGLTYRAWYTRCQLEDDREETDVVVRLPKFDAAGDQQKSAQREADLPNYLSGLQLPIRTPRLVGIVPEGEGVIVVQQVLAGIPVEMRASRNHRERPWNAVAEAAAACHAIDPAPLGERTNALLNASRFVRPCLPSTALAFLRRFVPPRDSLFVELRRLVCYALQRRHVRCSTSKTKTLSKSLFASTLPALSASETRACLSSRF